MELIEIAPIDRQKVLRKLAIAYSSTNVDRFFSLIQVLDDLKSLFPKGILDTLYGDKAKVVENRINQFRFDVSIVESYYIGLDTKITDKEDINSPRFREYQKSLTKISSNYYYVVRVISDLIKRTILRNQTIPSKYWKQIDVDKKKMYPEKRREEGEIVDSESQG